jgi:hypothetical protein
MTCHVSYMASTIAVGKNRTRKYCDLGTVRAYMYRWSYIPRLLSRGMTLIRIAVISPFLMRVYNMVGTYVRTPAGGPSKMAYLVILKLIALIARPGKAPKWTNCGLQDLVHFEWEYTVQK